VRTLAKVRESGHHVVREVLPFRYLRRSRRESVVENTSPVKKTSLACAMHMENRDPRPLSSQQIKRTLA